MSLTRCPGFMVDQAVLLLRASRRGRPWRGSCSGPFLIQVLLEAGERLSDVGGAPQVSDGIRDRVVILETQQRRQLRFIELGHTNPHVVPKHKVEKSLLLTREVCADYHLGRVGTLLASEWRQRVRDVR